MSWLLRTWFIADYEVTDPSHSNYHHYFTMQQCRVRVAQCVSLHYEAKLSHITIQRLFSNDSLKFTHVRGLCFFSSSKNNLFPVNGIVLLCAMFLFNLITIRLKLRPAAHKKAIINWYALLQVLCPWIQFIAHYEMSCQHCRMAMIIHEVRSHIICIQRKFIADYVFTGPSHTKLKLRFHNTPLKGLDKSVCGETRVIIRHCPGPGVSE